jgi:hypothetical protein
MTTRGDTFRTIGLHRSGRGEVRVLQILLLSTGINKLSGIRDSGAGGGKGAVEKEGIRSY